MYYTAAWLCNVFTSVHCFTDIISQLLNTFPLLSPTLTLVLVLRWAENSTARNAFPMEKVNLSYRLDSSKQQTQFSVCEDTKDLQSLYLFIITFFNLILIYLYVLVAHITRWYAFFGQWVILFFTLEVYKVNSHWKSSLFILFLFKILS